MLIVSTVPKFQNHENVLYHPFLLVILTSKWEMYLFWKSIFGTSESKTHQNYEVVELLHYFPWLSKFRCVTPEWRVTVMWLFPIGIAVQTNINILNIYFKTGVQSTHLGRFRTIWKVDKIKSYFQINIRKCLVSFTSNIGMVLQSQYGSSRICFIHRNTIFGWFPVQLFFFILFIVHN